MLKTWSNFEISPSVCLNVIGVDWSKKLRQNVEISVGTSISTREEALFFPCDFFGVKFGVLDGSNQTLICM